MQTDRRDLLRRVVKIEAAERFHGLVATDPHHCDDFTQLKARVVARR